MPELFELVRELELEDRVELRNEVVPAEELPAIIAAADLGIVPYRNDVFTDGLLPTKLMEYAAIGLPSVAARTTAIEHYFRGTMVEFFTPGDAEDLARVVRDLCASPDDLERLARRSRHVSGVCTTGGTPDTPTSTSYAGSRAAERRRSVATELSVHCCDGEHACASCLDGGERDGSARHRGLRRTK